MADQVYLRAAGTSVLIDVSEGNPRIVHWGADLGPTAPPAELFVGPVPHSMFDLLVAASVIPQAARGWRGRPGLRGSRDGRAFSARLTLTEATVTDRTCTLLLADPNAALAVEVVLELDQTGMLLARHRVTNRGVDPYALESLTIVLPVPDHATEALDLTGRWSGEKHPQRRSIDQGTWLRSGRHGRTGHDSTLVIAAGTAGFGFRTGEVWAAHLGWSGNHESYIERIPDGEAVLGIGELLEAGEVVLAPGESYETPTAYAAYSAQGLDGISDRFYSWLRRRPGHPTTPRPVVLNTWEAVYFDHDLAALTELADSAAEVGVERFVLDDGWFLGRRDDSSGLGDWYVDPAVWPDGLAPLIDRLHARGLQFGLWVEPEMVNENSNLAREHPDWIAGPGGRRSEEWRSQQVLDLVNPGAWQYVFARLDALLTENRIDYLKWDQNRDQLELGHAGRPSTHAQTLAVYRLLGALRAVHPAVEIESCSSGGARVDLGILAHTDRVWASDTNDALERQTIQRWTGLVVPPELVGAHVGPATSHTTGRTHDLSFRVITALFGHFGLEWDIRSVSGTEREELRRAIAFYKEHRALIHSGRMVRIDHPDPAASAYGVVGRDGSEALFVYVALAASRAEVPARLRFAGLEADRNYRVSLGLPLAPGQTMQRTPPTWLADGAVVSGRVLGEAGLPMPLLNPEHAIVLTLVAVA